MFLVGLSPGAGHFRVPLKSQPSLFCNLALFIRRSVPAWHTILLLRSMKSLLIPHFLALSIKYLLRHYLRKCLEIIFYRKSPGIKSFCKYFQFCLESLKDTRRCNSPNMLLQINNDETKLDSLPHKNVF